MISCVISAWRARFICSVRPVIISPALADAECMAVICAPQKPAAESERGDAAAAGRIPAAAQAFLAQLARDAHAGADDLRVERAREPAVAGHEQHRHVCSRLVLGEQRYARSL